MATRRQCSAGTLLVLLLLTAVAADEATHKYKDGEDVVLWVNRIGPTHNPQETYAYGRLPWCTPTEKKQAHHKFDGFGSLLEGNELVDSGVAIKFKEARPAKKVCEALLDDESAAQFVHAVQNRYWLQMYMDELPIWGLVGEVVTDSEKNDGIRQPLIYTKRTLTITVNADQIIRVNITSDNLIPIKPGVMLPMVYEVAWVETTTELFEDRFDFYLDSNFFEHQIHWFSIFNSIMMVMFLCGLVALILMRTLRNDYVKYTLDDDGLDLDNVVDESGWKQVHGDVFRSPSELELFSAIVGTGHQLLALGFLGALFAIAGGLYRWRGGMISSLVTCYVLTSFIAGYSSGSYYKQCGGKDWKRTFAYTAFLYPGICFSALFCLNSIAVMYSSSAAIPFTSILGVCAIYVFLSVPLMVFGTIVGRNTTRSGVFPCRVSTLRRPIPVGPWYMQWGVISLLGGILPFGSIFIEIHFVFTSFWNYKYYYVYGFLLIVYTILAAVTTCVTIVSTYVILNNEDYRWHWMSLCSGASTAVYVFLYSIYYFFAKTQMSGFFQTAFYFGYIVISCVSIAVLCGSVGFSGARLFTSRIYRDLKND